MATFGNTNVIPLYKQRMGKQLHTALAHSKQALQSSSTLKKMAACRIIAALFLAFLVLASVCESRSLPEEYVVIKRTKRSPEPFFFGLGRRGRGGRRRVTGGFINPNPFSRPDRGLFPSQPILLG
ncbi:UNVERIFIED_CONTAM: hypothetical protein RMT77_009920 [Armadillidium vulgare]